MTPRVPLPESNQNGAPASSPGCSFRHQAFLYERRDDLIRVTAHFVREGLAGHERVLVVLGAPKLESLRRELGADAADVQFADMDEVGANPARIIPLWNDFADSARRGIRGVGEPVTLSRRGAELAECQIHEELLNLAFDGSFPFWLLCPYDASSLDPAIVDQARHSHPYVSSGDSKATSSATYPGVSALDPLRRSDLSAVPANAVRLSVTKATVGSARRALRSHAMALGLGTAATDDLASAAHEVIANSLRHGGGRGSVSMWAEDGFVICEVRDRGLFDQPLAGRTQPAAHGMGGRGLWMANQLCDLVQIRSLPDATVTRLHMARDRSGPGVPSPDRVSGAEPQS